MGGTSQEDAEREKSPEYIFIEFHYAEVKDLAKQLLTLITGTLVLTVSLTEKILPVASAFNTQKWLLGACWLALFLSLILAGLGIYTNYLAAESAHGSVIYDYQQDFKELSRKSYGYLDLAGILFAGALGLLALVGATRLFMQ